MNITLTTGRTSYLPVTDDVERGFTIKKVDAQNKGSLQGAVFRFEEIDGSYVTTGTTGFDGAISFQGTTCPMAPKLDLSDLREKLRERFGCERIAVQAGGRDAQWAVPAGKAA